MREVHNEKPSGLAGLVGDTEQYAGKNVSLEDAAIFVLRDCARITAVRPC